MPKAHGTCSPMPSFRQISISRSIHDTKAAMDTFDKANQAAIDKMKAADERLTAAMATLARQLNEQSTTLQALNDTLTVLNAARDGYVEAERKFGEILTNFTLSVVGAFGELIKKPRLFGFGDIFGDLLRGIADLGGEAWDIIKGVIKEAVGLPSDLLNGLLGGFSGVLILVALGLCAISIALVAYLKCQMNRLDRKIEMLSMPRVPMGTAGRKGRRTRETTKLLNDM